MEKKAKASDKEKAPSNGAALNGNAAKPAAKRASSPRKKATTRKTPATKEEKSRVSDEAIRIRAYLISERRERLAIPGDANSDWIEARRQLMAEPGEKWPEGRASARLVCSTPPPLRYSRLAAAKSGATSLTFSISRFIATACANTPPPPAYF